MYVYNVTYRVLYRVLYHVLYHVLNLVLSYLVNLVSTGHQEGGQSRGSNSWADGITSHLSVDTSVPFPPGLGRSEHTSGPTHVTVSSLSGSVGSTTTDTRDTSNSTASTPRFSGGLVTSFLGYSVGLRNEGLKLDKQEQGLAWHVITLGWKSEKVTFYKLLSNDENWKTYSFY